jgi:hypothetical protein
LSRFGIGILEKKLGKRYWNLQRIGNYDGDVLQAVAEGTIAFHSSVERWENPMKLDVGICKE